MAIYISLFSGNYLVAQRAPKLEISYHTLDFRGPSSGNYFSFLSMRPGVSVGGRLYVNRFLDLSMSSSFFPPFAAASPSIPAPSSFLTDAFLSAELKSNGTLFMENALLAPYLRAGFGVSAFEDRAWMYVPLGLGLKVRVSPRISFFVQSTLRMGLAEANPYPNLAHKAGILYQVGPYYYDKPKDNPVDWPQLSDRDGDGVPDIDDSCPDKKGPPLNFGCPEPEIAGVSDRDRDGIPDVDDACPDVKGLARYSGCPSPENGDRSPPLINTNPQSTSFPQSTPADNLDSDLDGVPDKYDPCRLEPGPRHLDGCPENSTYAKILDLSIQDYPILPWPVPRWSTNTRIPRSLLYNAETLQEVQLLLTQSLIRAGYPQYSYYLLPDNLGFAIVAKQERIYQDGSPWPGDERWNVDINYTSLQEGKTFLDQIWNYGKSIFLPAGGRFRFVIILVSRQPQTEAGPVASQSYMASMVESGSRRLPETFMERPFTEQYDCIALIYEYFQGEYDDSPKLVRPSRVLGREHLIKAKILSE